MNAHPYRATALPAPIAPAPREFVYASSDQERHVAPGRVLLQSMIVGGFAATGFTMAGLQEIGLAVLVATIAFGVWRWRSARDIEGMRLVVDDGVLTVATQSSGRTILRIPLRKLRDVELQTKAIQRLVRDTRIAVVDAATNVGPKTDVTRIVLVPSAPEAPLPLTDAFVAHIEALDDFARLRRFLRAHGWLPKDERPARRKLHRGGASD